MYYFIPYQMAIHYEVELAAMNFSIKRYAPVSAEDVSRVAAALEELRVLCPNGAAALFGRQFAEYHIDALRSGDTLVLVHGSQFAVVQHEEGKTPPDNGAEPAAKDMTNTEIIKTLHNMAGDAMPLVGALAKGVAKKTLPIAGNLMRSVQEKTEPIREKVAKTAAKVVRSRQITHYFIPYQMAIHHEVELTDMGFSIKRYSPVSAEDASRVVAALEELRVLCPNGATELFGRKFTEYRIGDLRNGDALVLVHGNQFALVRYEANAIPPSEASTPPGNETSNSSDDIKQRNNVTEDAESPIEAAIKNVAGKAMPVADKLTKKVRKKARSMGGAVKPGMKMKKAKKHHHYNLYIIAALLLAVLLWPKSEEGTESLEEHETPGATAKQPDIEPQSRESKLLPAISSTQSAATHEADPVIIFANTMSSNDLEGTMILIDGMVSYFENSTYRSNENIMKIIDSAKKTNQICRERFAGVASIPISVYRRIVLDIKWSFLILSISESILTM